MDAKKLHRLRVLINAFLVKKKGTKTAFLSRVAKGVAKLRSVTPGHPLAPPLHITPILVMQKLYVSGLFLFIKNNGSASLHSQNRGQLYDKQEVLVTVLG